jgi:acetolactate synthase-1/2/3 large subunit
MGLINGGHLVGKYLKEIEKVDIVFGISGGHLESILDSFTEYKIRTIDVRHEQAAAMMAHAWSIYTGKPGVCFLTAGPGFTNGITGIANAYLDNAPLVVLCGRAPLRDDIKGALQEMNQIEVVRPITKWAATCYDIKRIPEYLSIAFRNATGGRPGPVMLELPPDILNIQVEESLAPMPSRSNPKYTVHPDDADLKAAAEIINNAKKPLFIGGSGVRFSDNSMALRAFIEKSGVPFMLLNNGRGELPDDHPNSVMDMGQLGLFFGISQNDVIIAAGLRFNWLLQFGQLIPPTMKIIRIDIDSLEINRNVEATVGLVGDAGSVLEQLTPLVSQNNHSEWMNTLKAAGRSVLDSELRARETASDPIHPVRLVAQIQKYVGNDAIYVADGGDTQYFGLAFSSKESSLLPRACWDVWARVFHSAWPRSWPDPIRRWWFSTATDHSVSTPWNSTPWCATIFRWSA